jgi:hypothetical protein
MNASECKSEFLQQVKSARKTPARATAARAAANGSAKKTPKKTIEPESDDADRDRFYTFIFGQNLIRKVLFQIVENIASKNIKLSEYSGQ